MRLGWLGAALAAGCQIVSGLNGYHPAPGGSGGSGQCCSDVNSCIGYCDALCDQCATAPTPTKCKTLCAKLTPAANPACVCDLAPNACPNGVPDSCSPKPTSASSGAGGTIISSGSGSGSTGSSSVADCCSNYPGQGDCQKTCSYLCTGCSNDPPREMNCKLACGGLATTNMCICKASQCDAMSFPISVCGAMGT